MRKTLISVVVTCYNESGNIREMYTRVKSVIATLPGYEFELIFVDNASTDGSESIFSSLGQRDRRVKVIVMSRNFGSPQPSFLAGLQYAKGKAVVLLHGDIQDPPELIREFILHWRKGYDIVYGVRKKRRGATALMNVLYRGFYFFLQKLAYFPIPPDAGEFSLIGRKPMEALLAMDEYDYYLRCLRAYVGFRQIGVSYVRDARHAGRSNESLMSGFWWAKTLIINFSFKPLEWISLTAFFVMLMTLVLIIINISMIIVYRDAPRGIPTIVILILFLGGVQLLSLSVIAEYLAKIFLEVKRRPRYIIRNTINL
ncbi:glycosyltransferase family 2 protein [Candidatus Gottesmanbacteria bacterium]|nr:glycosyltransferase family 2 protein [Candidatus Gottesmanbacteria bacterium]